MKSPSHLMLFTVLLASSLSTLAQKPPVETFLLRHGVTAIAILPPSGETVPQAVRNAAGAKLIEAIKSQQPGIEVSSASDTLGKLEAAGGLEDLTNFLTLFVKTGTINKSAVVRMSEAAGSSALLLIEVQEYSERGGSWLRSRSGQNTARIQYTLFSPTGEQLWQNLESLHRSQLTTTVAPMEEIMSRMSHRAVTALAAGKENLDPKQKRGGRFPL